MKRVTFYLDDEAYRQLKIVLAIHGKSASEWLREEISHYVHGSTTGISVEELARLPRPARRSPEPPKPADFDENIDLQ